MKSLVDKLEKERILSRDEFKQLLSEKNEYLFERARAVRHEVYGNEVFMRGLIEFTNYCKNNCYYCGIRAGNKNAQRYRLSRAQILECCELGYELGFRTFVLQGGEDPAYTDFVEIVKDIRTAYPDCAITLSIGEQSYETYKTLFEAGANRYLLRHETANDAHYKQLHPEGMSLENRKKCLWNLKEIGFQVGCGFMVGSPGQTMDCIVDDLRFIHELQPAMVGIGPFIPHKDTPFKDCKAGDFQLTLRLLAVLRLMKPDLLLPATTALGTLDPQGREQGILAGGNVVMPNLSPVDVRSKYMLYDNKICTGDEAAECRSCMQWRMVSIGYDVVISKGDPICIM
ncbi:MAG: [FeFe] hydrogenase H-cluster radical SAM maturase HydE [Clostridiales Family XIII bacterium]|jgi:biotin synthase|nr:[FeFe] hydrogenase H-cluster radical SAM maturase HydE [Clostridiales Family XIII bacterium]